MCCHILLLGLDWSWHCLMVQAMVNWSHLHTRGIPPTDDLDLETWLDTSNNSYDIYVLGYIQRLSSANLSEIIVSLHNTLIADHCCRFQEIIPLSTRNVLGLEESKMAGKWNSIIDATLNKSLPEQRPTQMFEPVEHRKVYPVKDGCHRERRAGDFSMAFHCCWGSEACWFCRCDRILWLGEGLKQIEYERCESQLSDHRPVRAIFTAEVDADVLQSSNAMDGQGGVRNG
ncbi:hypothetical protein BHE74_00011481 [Ensete ventricosum]|nr:hypothetical protein BHE74_00011481 [Ensete ventricosum]